MGQNGEGIALVAPQAKSCSSAVQHRAGVQLRPQSKHAFFGLQPSIALVCYLMIFTPVISVITWITTRLPILLGSGLINGGQFTQSGHLSAIGQVQVGGS